MALVLDATVAGLNSNSYVTRAEGDAYHESRLHSSVWTSASGINKDTALVWATRMMDSYFEWAGTPYLYVQALRWPRHGTYDRDGDFYPPEQIPQPIKDATCELARLLLAKDRTLEKGTEGITGLSVGEVSLDFDKYDRLPVIPDAVYQIVSHLGTLRQVGSVGGVSAVPLVRC